MASTQKLCVAAIQMCSTNNKLTNLKRTLRLVRQAVTDHPNIDMVCLPECCTFMGASTAETVAAAEPIITDSSYLSSMCEIDFTNVSDAAHDSYTGTAYINCVAGLCRIAAEENVWVSVGGFPEKIPLQRDLSDDTSSCDSTDSYGMANAHFIIDNKGAIRSPIYRKMHLFDCPLANLYESKSTVGGSELVCAQIGSWGQAGLTVCYDLRFPEMFQALRFPQNKSEPNAVHATSGGAPQCATEVQANTVLEGSPAGVDFFLVPSAFTRPTGRAHWEVLLRARAIETQCYVIAAAQAGQHNEKRASYGHTLIIDPWGTIVAQLGEEDEGYCYAELDRAVLDRVRNNMPIKDHKRLGPFATASWKC